MDLRDYFTDFQITDREIRLHELAKQYHMQCEAYDVQVCTGPTTKDGIMPATPKELAMINKNAYKVLQEIRNIAQQEGFTIAELGRAISRYTPEPEGNWTRTHYQP